MHMYSPLSDTHDYVGCPLTTVPEDGSMKTFGILRAAVLICSLVGVSAVSALADNSMKFPTSERLIPFPGINLGVTQVRGQEAIDRLGIHLSDVASWYGKSPDEFRKELLNDTRMHLDQNGRLFEVWDLDQMAPPRQADGFQHSSVQDGALTGLDQTFYLHSHPGANRTIYLDFTGATISGTAWNASQKNPSIAAVPFDLDGNPGSFSDTELQRIQYIWQRVAEDYAPFDVDVTTEAPSQDTLTRSGVNDQVFGTTVVITKKDGVYNCSCGGIAYVGVFDAVPGSHPADYYKPAFVFYDMLASGNEKAVAEAISHEAGHNMGLHHDGQGSTEYYAGQGDDAKTGWAPIMGVGYYRPLVQFSKGEYSGASNKENDFVIAQNFGLPLRLDDYGSTTTTATPFVQVRTGSTAYGSMDGVIETASDRDVFSIAAGPGPLRVDVQPANRSPDVDIMVSLLNASGQVLASDNPLNALNATLNYTIPAQGTYFLEVKGTGQGDPAATGYSSYGSVGNFRLTASYSAPDGTPPTAVIVATPNDGPAPLSVTLDGTPSRDDGQVAFWYWDFGDGNNDVTGSLSSAIHVYQVAGSYLARLTVVDNTGLSSSTTQVINVSVPAPQASVLSIQVNPKTNSKGSAWAVATVAVVDQIGKPLRGAKVSANWNGIVSKSSTALTNRYGLVNFTSPKTKAVGCFNLTVTNIVSSGHPFNASAPRTSQACR